MRLIEVVIMALKETGALLRWLAMATALAVVGLGTMGCGVARGAGPTTEEAPSCALPPVSDTPTAHVGTATRAPTIPELDGEMPTQYETATFALG